MAMLNGRLFTKNEWDELTEQIELSPRQADIAYHLMEGMGDKQIAQKLGIAVPTVRTHLGRLFARLDVQDRNELTLHIFRQFRTGCLKKGCPRRSRHRN